jgi:hypothetical protein
MKTTPTQRLVKKAIARTRKTGFRRTHESLKELMPFVERWKGQSDVGYSTMRVSEAVRRVREAHRADIGTIDAEREKAVALLRRAHWWDGGAVHRDELARTESTHVRIAHDNVADFFVHETPKSFENRERTKYWATGWAFAALTFLGGSFKDALALKHQDFAHNFKYAVLAGAIAVALRIGIDGIARFNQLTPTEFKSRVDRASGAVESALKSIEREIEGSATTDAKK